MNRPGHLTGSHQRDGSRRLIPVAPQPEPASFDSRVRIPGTSSLLAQGINIAAPLPPRTSLHPYWRDCMDDLYRSYDGICAYLGIYIERATGAASADHFVAKSSLPGLAYEWDNYRLACLAMNRLKNRFDDVLDPFSIPADLFRIELITGRIYCNSSHPLHLRKKAGKTIARLQLDSGINRTMRSKHFSDYLALSSQAGAAARNYFKSQSPFVWTEIVRQGL